MLPLPIEYFGATVVVVLVAASFVWTGVYGVLAAPNCLNLDVECTPTNQFWSFYGSVLMLTIYLAGFGALLYYLVRRGRRIKKKYQF